MYNALFFVSVLFLLLGGLFFAFVLYFYVFFLKNTRLPTAGFSLFFFFFFLTVERI